MPEDIQDATQARDRPTEELLRLPRTDMGYVEGLTGPEVQELANALGGIISTTLPSGNFLSLEPQEVDDPDRLDYGPAA